MPDKPLWLGRLNTILESLERSASPWVDRAAVEQILGVGRRRAQQLLSPVARKVGSSSVAPKSDFIAHLKRVADGETQKYEAIRVRRLALTLNRAREEWIAHPPVLVEVPAEIVDDLNRCGLDALPEGLDIAPGQITIHFHSSEEALQKLMALALAIGRDPADFAQQIAATHSPAPDF